MKIAICDDCLSDIRNLEKLILESTEHPEDITFYDFLNGEALLDSHETFAVIFLDIKMKTEREGTEIAESIRLADMDTLLVFYTAYDYPASRIFRVQPYSYLLKDAPAKELKSALQRILQEAARRDRPCHLLVKYAGTIFTLKPADILYICIQDKGSAIYLTEEKADEIFRISERKQAPKELFVKSGVKLDSYYEQLKDFGFIYAKKSYIINAQYIVARSRDSVLLKDKTELTVSRSRKKQFDDALGRYWSTRYRKDEKEWT